MFLTFTICRPNLAQEKMITFSAQIGSEADSGLYTLFRTCSCSSASNSVGYRVGYPPFLKHNVVACCRAQRLTTQANNYIDEDAAQVWTGQRAVQSCFVI